MTLAEALQPKLSEWRPSGSGRHTWSETFPDQGWAVHLAVHTNDTLSALVWEATLVRTAEPPAGLTLKAWAAGIANRVAGLMEDVKVIEIDATRDEALLRSDEPTRKGDVVHFYEIRLSGLKQAIVRRFRADTAANTRREQVAFALTHEVLANLIEEIGR